MASPPNKRGVGAKTNDTVSKTELADMLEGFKNEVSNDLKLEVEKSMRDLELRASASFSEKTAKLLTKYDETQSAKFDQVHSDITEIREQLDKKEKRHVNCGKTFVNFKTVWHWLAPRPWLNKFWTMTSLIVHYIWIPLSWVPLPRFPKPTCWQPLPPGSRNCVCKRTSGKSQAPSPANSFLCVSSARPLLLQGLLRKQTCPSRTLMVPGGPSQSMMTMGPPRTCSSGGTGIPKCLHKTVWAAKWPWPFAKCTVLRWHSIVKGTVKFSPKISHSSGQMLLQGKRKTSSGTTCSFRNWGGQNKYCLTNSTSWTLQPIRHMLSSGVFNTLLFPGNPSHPCKELRITTWNCRALFCRNGRSKWKKINRVLQIAANADIILLQETHGDKFIMDLLLSSLTRNFLIFGSFLNRGTGGVITAVSKQHTPNERDILHETFSPGRIIGTSITGLQSTLVFMEHTQLRHAQS
jgi:hypothetical protein